jgi:hypothetical protein
MKSKMKEIEKVYAKARSSAAAKGRGKKGKGRKGPPLDRRMVKDKKVRGGRQRVLVGYNWRRRLHAPRVTRSGACDVRRVATDECLLVRVRPCRRAGDDPRPAEDEEEREGREGRAAEVGARGGWALRPHGLCQSLCKALVAIS